MDSLETHHMNSTLRSYLVTDMVDDMTTVAPVNQLHRWISYIIPCAIFLIVFTGVSGNSLVLYVIAKHKDMRTVTNYFVANLAITDLCLLLICSIPTALLFSSWRIGEFMCKTMSYMQSVTVQATCLTLTVMTIDRYNLIVHAVRSRNTRTTFRAAALNAVIWIVSFCIHSPALFSVILNEEGNCVRDFKNKNGTILHYIFGSVFLMFVVPLAVIMYCYLQILIQVWRKTSEGTESAQAQARALRRKKKITKMVFIVVVLFACCWAPAHIFNTVALLVSSPSDFIIMAQIFAMILAYTNSIVNPFVYAFTTTSFKKYFRRIFNNCRCRSVQGDMMTSVSISMKTKTERITTQNGTSSKDDSSI